MDHHLYHKATEDLLASDCLIQTYRGTVLTHLLIEANREPLFSELKTGAIRNTLCKHHKVSEGV